MGGKDLSIADQKVNAQLYFCLANACLRGHAVLLYGGMGANKTTLVNLLGSSFLGLELERVEDLMVTGHPEQTEEKIVGFLDPRQWTGQEAGPTRRICFWRYCRRGGSSMPGRSASRETPATLPP